MNLQHTHFVENNID